MTAMMKRRDAARFRKFVASVSIVAGLIGLAVWGINRPALHKAVIGYLISKSGMEVSYDLFHWDMLRSSMDFGNFLAENRAKGLRIAFDDGHIDYSVLGFVRGRFVIDSLKVKGADIELPPKAEAKEKKRRRFDIAKLALVKNIEIVSGEIDQAHISFGKDVGLDSDQIRLSLTRGFFGGSKLAIRSDGLTLAKGDKRILSSGSLNIKASTNLKNWTPDFPYLNDIKGSLNVQDTDIEGLSVDRLSARASYRDKAVDLSELTIDIGGRTLDGKVALDFGTEEFDILIDIKEPIKLPHFGKDVRTLYTAGQLDGTIALNGKGLLPSKSSGSGIVKITHLFDASPKAPVALDTKVAWREGVISLSDASGRAGESQFSIDGSIDIPGKMIDLSASGKRFPIEHVFEKFKNKDIAKIFGESDFEGTFKGWGKNFTAHVTGTTYGGGWKPISAEIVKTELEVTYDELKLVGQIFDGDRQTGSADLSIKYGGIEPDGFRGKWIELEANLDGQPLKDSMAAYGLDGIGRGSIKISGHYKTFKGLTDVVINKGSWKGVKFGQISSKIDLTRTKLTFRDIAFITERSRANTEGASVIADLTPGLKMHLHGKPAENIDLDITYLYESGRWNINDIEWTDAGTSETSFNISGDITAGKSMDIKAAGQFDLAALRHFTNMAGGGGGLADVDLSIRGASEDPKIYGEITFRNNELSIKPLMTALDGLTGSIKFEGSRVVFEDVKASAQDGDINLTGYIDHKNFEPTSADIRLSGSAIRYRSPDDSLALEFEGDLTMKGRFPDPLLAGNVNILDGKYSKDFDIIDAISGKKPMRRKKEPEGTFKLDPRLDLSIRNTGEMSIENNIGDIWLNVNINAKGTRDKPIVSGSIDVEYGMVYYLGVNFELTRGFVEFRERYAAPYIEAYGEREIGEYNINAVLHGYTDNLALDLSATSPYGPLEKRDVVSLILFGMTEQERLELAEQRGDDMTTEMLARGVSFVMERPVAKITRLDVFRLEASDSPDNSRSVSRIMMGKKLSDRLSFNFATDIDTQDSTQTVIAEYLLTNSLLLKGSRSTDGDYEISGALRFKKR